MAKLYKRSKGSYFFEREVKGGEPEIVNIYMIGKGMWGYSVGMSMTLGTFGSFKEAKEKLMPPEEPAERQRRKAAKHFRVYKNGKELGIYTIESYCDKFGTSKSTAYRIMNNMSNAAKYGILTEEVNEDGTKLDDNLDFDHYAEKYNAVKEFVEVCQQLRAAWYKPKKISDTGNQWIIKRIPNSQKPKVNGWLS